MIALYSTSVLGLCVTEKKEELKKETDIIINKRNGLDSH